MATFGAIKTRIADELDETALSSQIADAVRLGIKRWEGERFHFNEVRDLTFNTVDGQALYTSSDASWIPDVVKLDDGYVTVSSQYRLLTRCDPFELELMSDNSASEGEPRDWAYYNQNIRFYPIPDAVYAVRFYGVKRLTALSADGDSNAWTTDAEDLTVAAAKRWILQHVIRDQDYAAAMALAENEAADRLRSEHTRRHATGTIRPMAF